MLYLASTTWLGGNHNSFWPVINLQSANSGRTKQPSIKVLRSGFPLS